MIFAFLSRRLRTWLLFTLLLPVAGRLLQAVGGRVGPRSPRVADALTNLGGIARSPRQATRGRRARYVPKPGRRARYFPKPCR